MTSNNDHWGQNENLVPRYTRGIVSLSPSPSRVAITETKAKAWCLLKPPKRLSPSHGGQGKSLVPPYTRKSVSLSLSNNDPGNPAPPSFAIDSFFRHPLLL